MIQGRQRHSRVGGFGRVVGAGAVLGLVGTAGAMAASVPAFADTTPYELYCPGTPVGNVVLNNTVTTGKLQVSGSTVNLTNWQTKTVLPSQLVQASSALNPSGLQGTATSGVDFTGATPATVNPPTVNINQTWPTPVGDMTLQLPTPPSTVGPATVTGATVTASVDSNVKLTITNPPVSLTCHTYANNAMASGITQSTPPGSPTTVQIDSTAATPGAAPAAATPAPATAAAASPTLPQTGPGPGLYLLAVAGLGSIVLAALLFVVGRLPRTALRAGAGSRTAERRTEDG